MVSRIRWSDPWQLQVVHPVSFPPCLMNVEDRGKNLNREIQLPANPQVEWSSSPLLHIIGGSLLRLEAAPI